MSTKSRQTIYGGAIMGAQIRAEAPACGPSMQRARRIGLKRNNGHSKWKPLADLRSRRQQLDNALMEALAGLRWSAGGVRRERVCRLMRSAVRLAHRSGNLRPR